MLGFSQAFVPDPNRIYHIDNPAHGLRLAASGNSEELESAPLSSTGENTQWRFVPSSVAGLWHIDRAAGGITPRIRTDLSTSPDMQTSSASGVWTRFSIEANPNPNRAGTYLLTVPQANTDNQRLRLRSNGTTDFATNNNTGSNPSFIFTEVDAPNPPANNPGLPFTIEAENTILSGVAVRNTHTGFSGLGYADYEAASDAFMAWDVNTVTSTRAVIEFRYALGAAASRTLNVEVNNNVVGQLTFESTGDWSQWTEASLELNITAGSNNIRLVATGQSGPNIDIVSMREIAGQVPTQPTGGFTSLFTIEAEDTVLSGVSEQNSNQGFSGRGYADYAGSSDTFIAWDFNVASASPVTFDLRYALGATASRTLAVELNGTVIDQITFDSTGSWTTWLNASFTASPRSGSNSIRLISIGESGPNIDLIRALHLSSGDTPLTYQVSTEEQVIFDTPILFLDHSFNSSQDYIERTIELTNVVDEAVVISSMSVDGLFSLQNPALADGAVIGPGDTLEVVVEFDPSSETITNTNFIFFGTLEVRSNDPVAPLYTIDLSGTDLGQPDVRAELTPGGMFEMLGLVADTDGFLPRPSQIGGVGSDAPVVRGEVTVNVNGEQQRALFFEAADPNAPVRVQQLASMHNSGDSNLRVNSYSYDASLGEVSDSGAFSLINELGRYRHDPDWFRTLFPPRTDQTRVIDIDTNGEIISFVVNGGTPMGPKSNGNIALQAFELYDEDTLQRIEDSYILLFDFGGGVGGDWNDNIYLVDNVRPFGDALRFSAISDGDGSLQDGDINIDLDASFTLTININQQDVSFDASTVNGNNVQLINVSTGQVVPGSVNSTAFLNAITFTPAQTLAPNTEYVLVVDGVFANNGEPYENITLGFTTGASTSGTPMDGIAFEERAVINPDGNGTLVTGLAFNADQSKLYATTLAGKLLRWDVDQQSNFSNPQSLQVAPEFHALIGLTFDKSNPNRLWFANNTPVGTAETGLAENFSSKLSYIDINPNSFNFAGTVTDYVTGIPRGSRDHMFNSIEFGPDGFLYGTVGSTSTTGTREFPLSAAMLRFDTDRQQPAGGFNVNTDQGYNPFAFNAPVTVYAEGLRNSYDLVWHSNGFLYSANNGSIGGGGTPDDPATAVNEAIPFGVATQSDFLYRVESGGYYGHPNVTLGNYILAGGNPTAGIDPAEEILYPVGTQPDPNYRGFAYDFGLNRSPNGSIEYTANTFGGRLNGTLMVAEWSGGDRIVGLTLNQSGQVVSNFVVADGFSNPIDIAVHDNTGNIIVAEMGASGEITVLSPVP